MSSVNAQNDKKVGDKKVVDTAKNLQEVVVTGQFEPQSLRNSVYNVRVIDAARIRLRSTTDLKTLLANELGLRFQNDPATGVADLQMAGVTGAGVKILLDGVPMMDRGTSKESIGQIDINTIDRIELVEGPMSVIYGSDAMAGVINVITKKNALESRFSVNARIQEETAGKKYNAFDKSGTHNGNLGLTWQRDGWQVAVSGTRNNFGGWNGTGTDAGVTWLPKKQWLGSGMAGYKKGNADVWYRFNGTDETLFYDGGINPNTMVGSNKEYISKRLFHQVQGDFKISDKLSFNAASSYTDYSRRTLSTNTDVNTGKVTLATDPGSQDKDIFGSTFFRGTAVYKLNDAVYFQPGIEFNNSEGSGGRIQGNPSINDYAFFLSSQINLGDFVQIRPGFRMVKNSVYDAPPFIPSLNTKFKLNDQFDLRLGYARGFRAPILRELYFIFKDSSHDIVGNENLKAEHSNSWNGSLAYTASNLGVVKYSSTLSGFYNKFRNQIEIGTDPAVSTANVYLNIEESETVGAEFNNTLGWKNLQITLGASYIARYNLYSRVSNTSQFMWTPEVSTNISYLVDAIGTNVGFFYKFNGKRPNFYPSLNATTGETDILPSEIAAFHLADLTLSKPAGKFVNINAGVRNLFNVTRLTNTSTESGAHTTTGSVPMGYGRSFFLGLTMQFSK
ncbi:MAG: TonB-dependent receptor [Pedobacter sp.]|nr:MAG: TonB-dependent receptor [Pedobacter sp.]